MHSWRGADGNVYLADTGTAEFNEPHGVYVCPSGTLYLVDATTTACSGSTAERLRFPLAPAATTDLATFLAALRLLPADLIPPKAHDCLAAKVAAHDHQLIPTTPGGFGPAHAAAGAATRTAPPAAPASRSAAPCPNRSTARSTPGILFWQCREAPGRRGNVGKPRRQLAAWARTGKKLELSQDYQDPRSSGQKLTRFYDGEGVPLLRLRGRRRPQGDCRASVRHGRARNRPRPARHAAAELFGSFLRRRRFHESSPMPGAPDGAGDKPTREAVLAKSPDLGTGNFLESLSGVPLRRRPAPVRQCRSLPAAARPQRFQWKLPSTCRRPVPGSSHLLSVRPTASAECSPLLLRHTPRHLHGDAQPGEASLLQAATVAGKLLLAGVRGSPQTAR